MTDRQIHYLIAAADPLGAAEAGEGPLTSTEIELRDAIVVGSRAARRRHRTVGRPSRRLARRAIAVGLIAAAGLGVAAMAGLGPRFGDGAQPAWAAGALELAERSPRLLLADGWAVAGVNEAGPGTGEMAFVRDEERYDLFWRPGALHRSYVEDRSDPGGLERVGTGQVLGHEAMIFRYLGGRDYTALWLQGAHSMELRGVARSGLEGFRAVLGSVRPANVDEWLSALPASAVRPYGRAGVVDEMLVGIPLPEGFDLTSLRTGTGLVKDRYQLGAEVSGSVACAWIGRWVDARAVGDAEQAQSAATALSTSHDWPILREMEPQGGWSQVLWEYADAIAGDGRVPAGSPGREIASSYREALGCTAP